MPEECFDLIKLVVNSCPHCQAFKPVPRRPRFGAELAGHFGDCVVLDLFYIFGKHFYLHVKVAKELAVSTIRLKTCPGFPIINCTTQ